MSLAARRSARHSPRPLPGFLREPFLPMFPSAYGPGVSRVLGDHRRVRLSAVPGPREVELELETLDGERFERRLRLRLGPRPRLSTGIGQRARWAMAAGLPRSASGDAFLDFRESVVSSFLDKRRPTGQEERERASHWSRFADKTVREMAIYAVSLCEPEPLQAARRFPLCMRFWLYRRLVRDHSGRILQLTRSAPGAVSFAFALGEHRVFRPLVRGLFDGVVAGRRLNPLLAEVLDGWCEAGTRFALSRSEAGRRPWLRLRDASPREREQLLEEQRLLLRRASPAVPPTLLLLPPPLGFVPDDIPRGTRANATWFRMMKGTAATLAVAPDADPEVQRALSLLLSRRALELSSRHPRRGRELVRLLGHYCVAQGRRPGRRADVTALLDASLRWQRRQRPVVDPGFVDAPPDFSPDTELPFTAGLDWTDGDSSVRALRTAAEVEAEGRRMHHCVASYALRAATGHLVLCHADLGGEPYTVEVRLDGPRIGPPSRLLGSVLGPCNTEPSDTARGLLDRWRRARGIGLPPHR